MAHLELKNLSLTYPVMGPTSVTLKNALGTVLTGGRVQKAAETRGSSYEVLALDNIDLTIESGERVGIIGQNGAGKTTLLKVLAGIFTASSGHFRREGKVGTVINPSNGLQRGITGYENIENIGLISGLSIQEARGLIPEIEEFTELGPFLSLPVETYSSGMVARLAFAVATALSPEVLLIDENLSTGDRAFIEKARERMNSMIERSEILVLASHSFTMLPKFVDRALLLEHGKIKMDGPVADVIQTYRENTKPKQT